MTGSQHDENKPMDQLPAQCQLLLDQLLPRLGAKLLAYTLGRSSTAALSGPPTSRQQEEDLARLQLLSAVLDTLEEPDQVATAWLLGLNPQLGDISPARMLHERGGDAAPGLLVAAREHHR